MSETISIRLEGGIGDHLLANRFVPAIKEKHPNAKLYFYSDTENNPRQINILKSVWPSVYNTNCEVIEERNSLEFKAKSQFGEEIYSAHPNNVIDKYKSIFQSSNTHYNLCIDNLDWLNYSFDWKRYFYFFPKPEKETDNIINDNGYILTHLYPRPNSGHNLEQWYIISLLKKLLESGQKVVSICQKEYMDFYEEVINLNHPNFKLIDCTVHEVFSLARDCVSFIGADSGLRYIPLHYGKPTYVFSKYSNAPFTAAPSHILRWLIFEKYVLPMHFDLQAVCNILINSTLHPAYSLFPEIRNNIENHIIQRYYID